MRCAASLELLRAREKKQYLEAAVFDRRRAFGKGKGGTVGLQGDTTTIGIPLYLGCA